MEQLIREKGLRATPARIAILEVFARRKEPLNAKKVLAELWMNKSCADIDEVTVFRNLEALKKVELLRIVDLRRDSAYFELEKNHHHHVVCTNCERIEEFENEKIEKIISDIVKKTSKFINVKEHSMEFFGLCRNCA